MFHFFILIVYCEHGTKTGKRNILLTPRKLHSLRHRFKKPRKPETFSFSRIGLRKQPTFDEVTTWALAKRRLSNERRNSILVTRLYPDPGSASDWLELSFNTMRSTTKIWVETRHQYGISALVTQTLFCESSSGDLVKRWLFSQAIQEFADQRFGCQDAKPLTKRPDVSKKHILPYTFTAVKRRTRAQFPS